MYEYKNTPAKYDDFGPSNDWFNIIMFPKKIFTNLHRMGFLKKFQIYIFKKEKNLRFFFEFEGGKQKKNINPDCLRTSTSTILSYKSTEFSSILNSNKVIYENSQRHKNLHPPLTKIKFRLKTQKLPLFFRKH